MEKPTAASNSELSEAVRHWVHFDNLAESLNKQVANVRNLRNQFETQILELMDRAGFRNATLKITGAVLQRASRTKQSDLTWSYLEEQLHEYFKHKGSHDDTTAVIEFLQQHRGGRTTEYLKKTSVSPASPTPPPKHTDERRTITAPPTAAPTARAAATTAAAAAPAAAVPTVRPQTRPAASAATVASTKTELRNSLVSPRS